MNKRYKVSNIKQPIHINADWGKNSWKGIEDIELENYMCDRPIHFPEVNAKMRYDENSIYIIWKVKDQYVKAVHQKNHSPVSEDSCVEFFFSTSSETDKGYFNIEINCSGTILFKYREKEGNNFICLSDKEMDLINVAHTMPDSVPLEIQEPITWYLEYSIPFTILQKYAEFERPKSGSIWRANLYKIADETSHPHWLTWSKVDYPKPKFHLPEFFGELIFE